MKIWRAGATPVTADTAMPATVPARRRMSPRAKRSARRSAFPISSLDLSAEYEKRILDYFKDEYRTAGRPIPASDATRR